MAGKKRIKKVTNDGRPKIVIDMVLVDNLCQIQCTGEEIASVLKVDYDTLNARIKESTGSGFSDYIKVKSKGGKASLRRMQWKGAQEGNATMLVWLGKQYLGQNDKQEIEHSGKLNLTGELIKKYLKGE